MGRGVGKKAGFGCPLQVIMAIAVILFYVFSLLTLLSALMVISSSNPVHSVFFLILAFFNAAGLFILLGAELIAMMLVIVYVGAVAVLFLFVVMMLNINFIKMKEGFMKYLPVGMMVAVLLFVEIFFVLYTSSEKIPVLNSVPKNITNAEAIGRVLYTDYIYLFQLAGIVLLVAMIGAIVLTHRQREGVKKQSISKQIARNKKETLEIVKVESGSGT